MNGWINGQMGWMDGWLDRWMDRFDGHITNWLIVSCDLYFIQNNNTTILLVRENGGYVPNNYCNISNI